MIGTEKNERRDWTLLIFIIPIGIILIILVGQLAVRLVPFWRMDTDMNSNLEPDASSARPFALLEPILPQILTPMAWVESYLTPGAEISFPPFLTFEPTFTPSPTSPTPTGVTDTPTAVATGTPSPTSTAVTGTAVPTDPTDGGGGGGGGGTTTCQDTAANNFGGPLPCTYPPVQGCTDPAASNYNPLATVDDGSCTYPPVQGCTDPAALNYNPLATIDDGSCTYPPTGIISTLPTGFVQVTPAPTEIGIGTPPDNPVGGTSGLGILAQGTYIVINLSIVVENTPDANYDLVLYEYNNGGIIYLDRMIIGISNDSTGSTYYEVFNWGNGTADNNSNVGDVAGSEIDEQPVDPNELHDPDTPPGTADNQTGILIDVDTASSSPPPDVYDYIVVISPGGGGAMEVDSIDVTEVPIPTPTP